MELRQLRYFIQIVKCGSISRAAEILHIAQPSLSLQMKSLEEELGVALLIRHARGVVPTEFGIAFREHAELILRNAERARDSIRSMKASPVGRVALGLPITICRGMALDLVRSSAARYPGIEVHIIEAMTPTLDEWIRTGRLDVALLYDHRGLDQPSATDVLREDLMLIVPARSCLAAAGQVAFRDIATLPLVLPGPSNVVRLLLEQVSARLSMSLSAMDCDSLPAIRHLVRTGYATVLPHFSFSDEIGRGEVVAVPIIDPSPSWRLSLVVSETGRHQRASRAIGEVLVKVCADLVAAGAWRATLAPGIGDIAVEA